MARPTPEELPPVAVAAGNLFGGVVDNLAAALGKAVDIPNPMANLLKGVELKGFEGVTHGTTQVASNNVPNITTPDQSRGV